MKIPRCLLIGFVLLLTACSSHPGVGPTRPDPGGALRIGACLPLQGDFATYGEGARAAMELAVAEVNSKGGALGRKIELLIEDTGGDPDRAAGAARKLIREEGVVALLGGAISAEALATAPPCQEAGVPMLTPTATNSGVTQVGDMVFRTCFSDERQGYDLARFAAQSRGWKRAIMVVDRSTAYSRDLEAAFRQNFTNLGGGTVVAEESYTAGNADVSKVLASVSGTPADFVFLPGYAADAGRIANQARRQGVDVPFLGGDGWDSPALLRTGGRAMEGCYFSRHCDPQGPAPALARFRKQFLARAGREADSNAVQAYDAVMVLARALDRAGRLDRRALRDALASTANYEGLAGTLTLNAERDADRLAVFAKVQGGRIVPAGSRAPR